MRKYKNKILLGVILLTLFSLSFFINPQNTRAETAPCSVKSATFSPAGTRPSGWYTQSAPPNVLVDIQTKNCEGKTIEVSVTGGGVDIGALDNEKIVAPTTNHIILHLKAGEEKCSKLPGPDCSYYIRIDGSGIDFNSKEGVAGLLKYDCDGMCDLIGDDWVLERTELVQSGDVTPPVEPLGTCTVSVQEGPPQIITGKTKTECTALGGAWSAAGTTTDLTYHFLAQLPCDSGTPGCENGKLTTFDPAGDNKIGTYLNLMIKLFIGICAVLAVIMIVMGGIQYMTTELISSKEEGKERITHAIFGLLLALGAYTILFTINPDLLRTDLSSLKNVEVVVDLQDSVPQTAGGTDGKTYPNSTYKKGDPWGDNIGKVQNIPGVTKQSAECTTVGQGSGCLSTRNLTLTYINEVKRKCPTSQLILTGGTEFWHHGGQSGNTSHGPGNATVDLKTNSTLDQCLSGGEPLKKFKRYGNYYYESNHWHVGP